MCRFAILNEIRRLDPERDHQRIVFLDSCYEFPFDLTRALEFALFRTYCVPSISALLDQTGEFGQRPQKRYDDTDIIISEILEWGYDSPRGRRALRRMNQLHRRFRITNEEFLYVLSTFVFEPIRWMERHGWRPMCDQERLAWFYFWREVGRRMNIKDLSPDYDTFERFNRAYERDRYRYTDANRRVGTATLELFAGWFPRPIRPLIRRAMIAVMDDLLIAGFGFTRPSRPIRWLVRNALRLRACVLRRLPPRRQPRIKTLHHRWPSYPGGHVIEEIGPTEKT